MQHAKHAGARLSVAQPRLDGSESHWAQAPRALQSDKVQEKDTLQAIAAFSKAFLCCATA
jgi:hypothetical protein